MKTLRDYQGWAIDGNETHPGIIRALEKYRTTAAVLATGLGKTVIISKVATEWSRGNVLCLAHRIELVDQMADSLEAELGYRPIIEQGERGASEEALFSAGNIVVGSVQSMITERRIRKFKNNPFGLIIIDECHRATSPSYVKLIDRYVEIDPEMRLLGVTATPNRTDGTALGLVFDSVAFEMGIVEGIDKGWLVDIHQKYAVVENLDLSKVSCAKNEFGESDYKQSELEAMLTQEGPLHEMSRPLLGITQNGEQAIVFTASVAHAHLWAAVLNHYRPGCAAAVDGTMDKGEGGERTETIKKFKSGRLQFLLNYNIATEGFDAPKTAMVVMGRPTKSLLVKTQMLGRCTRPLAGTVDGLATPEERKDAIAASAKPWATALDFVGALRGDMIVATDILGGNYDVDVREAADDIIGASRGSANVRDALVKAKASMLLEAEEQRRKPIRNLIKDTDIGYTIGDIRSNGGVSRSSRQIKTRGTVSDAQIAALANLGMDRDKAASLSRQQAGAVMTKLRKERCTVGQAKQLVRFGYKPEQFNADSASKQIDLIAKNGWKRL